MSRTLYYLRNFKNEIQGKYKNSFYHQHQTITNSKCLLYFHINFFKQPSHLPFSQRIDSTMRFLYIFQTLPLEVLFLRSIQQQSQYNSLHNRVLDRGSRSASRSSDNAARSYIIPRFNVTRTQAFLLRIDDAVRHRHLRNPSRFVVKRMMKKKNIYIYIKLERSAERHSGCFNNIYRKATPAVARKKNVIFLRRGRRNERMELDFG